MGLGCRFRAPAVVVVVVVELGAADWLEIIGLSPRADRPALLLLSYFRSTWGLAHRVLLMAVEEACFARAEFYLADPGELLPSLLARGGWSDTRLFPPPPPIPYPLSPGLAWGTRRWLGVGNAPRRSSAAAS